MFEQLLENEVKVALAFSIDGCKDDTPGFVHFCTSWRNGKKHQLRYACRANSYVKDSNAGHIIQGSLPTPLNDRGRSQAKALGERLAQQTEEFHLVFSSSNTRASETTTIALSQGHNHQGYVCISQQRTHSPPLSFSPFQIGLLSSWIH